MEALVEVPVVVLSKILEAFGPAHRHRQQPDREAFKVPGTDGVNANNNLHCLCFIRLKPSRPSSFSSTSSSRPPRCRAGRARTSASGVRRRPFGEMRAMVKTNLGERLALGLVDCETVGEAQRELRPDEGVRGVRVLVGRLELELREDVLGAGLRGGEERATDRLDR